MEGVRCPPPSPPKKSSQIDVPACIFHVFSCVVDAPPEIDGEVQTTVSVHEDTETHDDGDNGSSGLSQSMTSLMWMLSLPLLLRLLRR